MPADKQRIRRLKTALREARLDAVILRLPENIVMSFGVWPMNGFSYAVFTADRGPLALIAPSCEDQEMDGCWAGDIRFFRWPLLVMPDPLESIRAQLRDIAKKHGLARGRIGYEGSFEAVAPSHNAGEILVPCESSITYLKSILPGAKWSNVTGLLRTQRATKTKMEIDRLRVTHKVANLGLRKFLKSVRIGTSEAVLASAVYTECLAKGVALRGIRHVNVYPQISSGPNAYRAWRPVVTTGNRKIQSGQTVLLELAVCVDGFWADVTRTKIAGRASEIQKRAHKTVKAAQAAAMNVIKPGAKICYPHDVATGILIDAGFEKNVTHITGHGVGFRYHEPFPMLMPGNMRKFRPGHVCSVEPGLYDKKWGGIRIEDNIVATNDGTEVLTKASKAI